jgi:hypothetical protein
LSDLALDSSVTTLTWGGAVGIPAAGSDYWLHPDVLAQIDEVVTDDLKIVRMPYSIGDTQFSSIWLQSISDLGNYTWVYDLDSGVLQHTAGATQGPPITGPVAQGEGAHGSTFLTQSTLVNMRQPAAVGDGRRTGVGRLGQPRRLRLHRHGRRHRFAHLPRGRPHGRPPHLGHGLGAVPVLAHSLLRCRTVGHRVHGARRRSRSGRWLVDLARRWTS